MSEAVPEEEEVLFDPDELYEGDPEDIPRTVDGKQDDSLSEMARGFMAASQNNTAETIEWYNRHGDNPPFDPDGMCLKICRTARNIGPMYPTAVSAQHATPTRYRVPRVRDLRRGMVVYYDDPNDSNPYGHVATMVGRVRGVAPHLMHSFVVETNSVVANKIVRVRGNYFPRHWGDKFQFGATWLNGQELKLPAPPRPRLGSTFDHAIADLTKSYRYHKGKGHTRIANALERDLAELKETQKNFG